LPGKGYILLTVGVFILSLIGCGLPGYTSIEKPVVMTNVDFIDDPLMPELSNTVIAFKTPVNDTDILGYSIFYKVYYSDTTDPDFALQPGALPGTKVDIDYFDEYTFINNNDEMQPGDYIPNERGFLRVGEFDKNTFEEFYINHPGPDEAIYIDFDPTGEGVSDSNLRKDPIIGYDFPVSTVKTLARGYTDPTDSLSNMFRRFVADWDFDLNDSGDQFNDGDLRRGYYLLSNQIAPSTLEEIEASGEPFYTNGMPSGGDMIIGFVVYSFGRDISGGSFSPIASKPVYFGDIKYTPLHDVTTQRSTNR